MSEMVYAWVTKRSQIVTVLLRLVIKIAGIWR